MALAFFMRCLNSKNLFFDIKLRGPKGSIEKILMQDREIFPDEIATTTSRPKAGEEEELRLVFKISISLLARLEISKLEVFSEICATNLNAYSEKSPRTYEDEL